MLLTIYNLPENTRYADVKTLIQSKCGLTDMILDNLLTTGPDTKKVTVGLAEEEDAAILVRKINGLYINGKQLFVEDVRKRKSTDQPYYSTRSNNVQEDHQTTQPFQQASQLYQQGTQQYQQEPQSYQNTQAFYMDSMGQNNSMATSSYTSAGYYMQPYTQQTSCASYGEQQQVQYPPPQGYQTTNHSDQEPLGFRAEPSDSQQSRTWGRNNGSKKSFSQKGPWSPEREPLHYSSSTKSGGNSRENSDVRRDRRRDSPKRDRRRNFERDNQHGTSRSSYNRDRSPQDFKRDSRKRSYDSARAPERKPYPNPKTTRWSDSKQQQQPWEKPNSGFSQPKDWGKKSNYLAKQALRSEPAVGNNDAPKAKRFRRPKPNTNFVPPETGTLDTEFLTKKDRQRNTWYGQAASAIYKELTQDMVIIGGDSMFFAKELKNIVRDRIIALNCSHTGSADMIVKYRNKYKMEDDKILAAKVLERVEMERQKEKEDMAAEEKSAEQEPEGSTPIAKEPTFKVPQNPVVKKATAKPPQSSASNKPLTGKLFIKEQKKENKIMFQNESVITDSLEPKLAAALEAETTVLLDKFLEGCRNGGETDGQFISRLTSTVANDFKTVLKVHLAQRIAKVGQPTLRVFCAPKMLKRSLMEPYLIGEGVTFLKKSDKHPMILASCRSWENHDRLCTMEPVKVHGKTITFKPLQLAGPPIKVTKDAIKQQRQKVIKNQIDNENGGAEDEEYDIMDETETGPEDYTEENPEDIENFEEQEKETNPDADNSAEGDIVKVEKVLENESNPEGSDKIDMNKEKNSKETNLDDNPINEENTDTIGKIDDKLNEQGKNTAVGPREELTSDAKIGDFTDDVTEVDKDKELTVEDYKIVEDTMGNCNNNDDSVGENLDAVQDDAGDADDGDEGVDPNCEDIEIGDIDENDLEDY